MADRRFPDLADAGTLDGTEQVALLDDPSGSPTSRRTTTQNIADLASGDDRGGSTSNADIDARIATWARADSPSGTVPDNVIPASIARDSEIPAAILPANAISPVSSQSLGAVGTSARYARQDHRHGAQQLIPNDFPGHTPIQGDRGRFVIVSRTNQARFELFGDAADLVRIPVAPPAGAAGQNKVWKTDGNRIAGWRDDATGGAGGTAPTLANVVTALGLAAVASTNRQMGVRRKNDDTGFEYYTITAGGAAITVEDEGTALATAAATLNFVGAGVTASGTGAEKTITIPGGGTGGNARSRQDTIDLLVGDAAGSVNFTRDGSGATSNLRGTIRNGVITAAMLAATVSGRLPAANPGNNLFWGTDGSGTLGWRAAPGGAAITVEDEGTALATAAATLNFVGSGVTASGAGAEKTITIPGGSGGTVATVTPETIHLNNVTIADDANEDVIGVDMTNTTVGTLITAVAANTVTLKAGSYQLTLQYEPASPVDWRFYPQVALYAGTTEIAVGDGDYWRAQSSDAGWDPRPTTQRLNFYLASDTIVQFRARQQEYTSAGNVVGRTGTLGDITVLVQPVGGIKGDPGSGGGAPTLANVVSALGLGAVATGNRQMGVRRKNDDTGFEYAAWPTGGGGSLTVVNPSTTQDYTSNSIPAQRVWATQQVGTGRGLETAIAAVNGSAGDYALAFYNVGANVTPSLYLHDGNAWVQISTGQVVPAARWIAAQGGGDNFYQSVVADALGGSGIAYDALYRTTSALPAQGSVLVDAGTPHDWDILDPANFGRAVVAGDLLWVEIEATIPSNVSAPVLRWEGSANEVLDGGDTELLAGRHRYVLTADRASADGTRIYGIASRDDSSDSTVTTTLHDAILFRGSNLGATRAAEIAIDIAEAEESFAPVTLFDGFVTLRTNQRWTGVNFDTEHEWSDFDAIHVRFPLREDPLLAGTYFASDLERLATQTDDQTSTWYGDSQLTAVFLVDQGGTGLAIGKSANRNQLLFAHSVNTSPASTAMQILGVNYGGVRGPKGDDGPHPWEAGRYYEENDVVVYGHMLHVCDQAHTSEDANRPDRGSQWEPVNEVSMWDQGRYYRQGAIVRSGNELYRCRRSNTADGTNAPAIDADQSHWYKLAQSAHWALIEGRPDTAAPWPTPPATFPYANLTGAPVIHGPAEWARAGDSSLVPAPKLDLSPSWTWVTNPEDAADGAAAALYLATRGGNSSFLRGATATRAGLLTAPDKVILDALATGRRFNWRGEWDVATTYQRDDIVHYNDSALGHPADGLFIANQETTGVHPNYPLQTDTHWDTLIYALNYTPTSMATGIAALTGNARLSYSALKNTPTIPTVPPQGSPWPTPPATFPYANLTGAPTIPPGAATPDWDAASGQPGEILNKPTIPTVPSTSNPWPTAPTIAWDDLTGRPTIPAAPDWDAASDAAGFIANKPSIPVPTTPVGLWVLGNAYGPRDIVYDYNSETGITVQAEARTVHVATLTNRPAGLDADSTEWHVIEIIRQSRHARSTTALDARITEVAAVPAIRDLGRATWPSASGTNGTWTFPRSSAPGNPIEHFVLPEGITEIAVISLQAVAHRGPLMWHLVGDLALLSNNPEGYSGGSNEPLAMPEWTDTTTPTDIDSVSYGAENFGINSQRQLAWRKRQRGHALTLQVYVR